MASVLVAVSLLGRLRRQHEPDADRDRRIDVRRIACPGNRDDAGGLCHAFGRADRVGHHRQSSTATIPVHRSAIKIGTGILMAPALDGGLYVLDPRQARLGPDPA